MSPNLLLSKNAFGKRKFSFKGAIRCLALTVACCSSSLWAQSWVTTPGGALPNDSIASTYFPYLATKTVTGISYGTRSSEVGDVWIPNYNGKTPPANSNSRPAVVVVHGGGGTSGTRTETRSTQTSQLLAAHGYVVFNVDYALGAVYPQNILDWRLAVRWLRANASTYGIDTNHIGLTGGSFGGYASAMLSGVTNGQRTLWPDSNSKYNNISLDTDGQGQPNIYSGDIQCVFDMYGPTDQNTSGNASGIYSSPTSTTLSNSSPVYYVHAGSAPIMIAHGTADSTVSPTQSRGLTNYLGLFHVPYVFDYIPGAAHTFCIYDTTKGGTWPSGGSSGTIDLRKDSMDFFDKWLINAANPPAITVQPSSASGCVGFAAGLSVTAGGTSPLAYQWYLGNSPVSGATNAAYTINSLATNNAGNYSVVITNQYGSVTSSVVVLTVNNLNPPNVVSDPTNFTVMAGQPASFSVSATGDSLAYQWYLNGSAIANATNSILNIASAANSDAGSYRVTVYNSCSAQTSATATLTVNGAPSVTAQPINVTSCSGDSASFAVTAIGNQPLTYQWYGPTGSISGASASSLVLTNLGVTDSGAYYVAISNGFGGVLSSNSILTVSANHDISFSSQPTNVTVNVAGSASFSVSVTGGGNYTYLWIKNDADPITNAVATNATLTFSNVALSDSAYYTCYVNNDCSTLSSAPATLTVNNTNSLGGGVVIAEIYASGGKTGAIYTNDYVVLKNTGGTAQSLNGWSLQHQKAGAWQTPFALPNAGIPPGGYYLIKLYNDGTALRGTTALPTPDATAPQTSVWNLSTSSPESVALVNTTSQLTPNNTNIVLTPAFSNVVDVVGFVAATTTNSYLGGGVAPATTVTSAAVRAQNGCQNTANNAADFSLATPNAFNSSSAPSLCISVAAPTIATQPQNQTNFAGSGVSLAVTANGSSPLAYQWRKGGSAITSANSAVFSISPATTNDSGNYDVVVTNLFGSVTSSVAIVLITNIPPTAPSITAQPQNQTAVPGASATFNVTASGTFPISYQWFKGVSPIANATNSFFIVSGIALGDSGSVYSVVVTNLYGTATSSNASLTVLNLGPYTNVVASSWATIRSGTNFTVDIDETTAGYVMVKYNASIAPSTGSAGAAKGYLAFDLTGSVPDTNSTAELDINSPSSSGAQHIQIWALNQSYPGMSSSITWQSAQANDTNSNSMLSNAPNPFTATLLLDVLASTATSNSFVLPASWAQSVVSNKLVLAVVGVSDAANNSAGYRMSITNTLPLPTLRFYQSINGNITTNQFLTAYDSGAGFFSGEVLIVTNNSGMNFYAWSSPDPSINVTNWTLEAKLDEIPLGGGVSRYSINVNPAGTNIYYIIASTNVGPYFPTEALASVTTSDFMSFNVTATNNPISTNGFFQFPSPPSITQNPSGKAVLIGQNASFNVVASGSTLVYQWMLSNSNLSGATGSVLVLSNVSPVQAGPYRVVVSNGYGAVTSSIANLTVSLPPGLTLAQGASAGTIQLSGTTLSNLTYVIQGATNLAAPNWVPVQTNITGPAGVLNFQTNINGTPAQYYRVVFP